MTAIHAYRLVKKKYQDNAFDGEGARLFGGRWNSPGKACVYLAGSESLALLEVLVHLDDHRCLHHYALLRVTLPESAILRLGSQHLPPDWREMPAPSVTAELGDDWLESGQSLALALPSVVVPREDNYLVNPAHADFGKMVSSAEPLSFDPDPRL